MSASARPLGRGPVGPHPALIEVAAGRGLPAVTEPGPLLHSAFAHGMAGLLLSEVERARPPWRR